MDASSLRLLGAFALETPFAAAPLRLGRKAQALLACAAMHGSDGITRQRLVALLWADHAQEDARGAFRQCLHLLRRRLGPAADLLDDDGERLTLRERALDVDVRRFESLVASSDAQALTPAVLLYRGDFVDGLDAGADFARWASAERERLRDLVYGLLARVSEERLDASSRAQAVRLAHVLLANDPVHEGCYRALMRLHAGAGLRAKALQVFDECRDALRRELGVQPDIETAALAREVSAPGAAPAPERLHSVRSGIVLPPTPVVSGARLGDDPRVVDLNLRGWESFTAYTAEGNRQARAAFEEAASLAGDHAQVIARAGWTYWTEAVSGWTPDPDAAMERAWYWASRAIACNHARHSTPHSLMGKILLWRHRHDEALEQLRMAVALEPGNAWSHFHLADGLMWSGQCDEALMEISRALELDQNDHGMFLTIRGLALWMPGQLQAARAALDSAVTRNPTYAWARLALAVVHFEGGDLEKARAAAAMAQRLHPSFTLSSADQVLPFRCAEHRRRQLDALRACGMPAT